MGKYIYGIIDEPVPHKCRIDISGIEGSRVYTINHQNIAAVVSNIDAEELDPTRKNVRTHTQVQEALMKNYTLLPMGFGMVSESEEKIKKLLTNNYKAIRDEIKRLEGKIELGVKVFWQKEAMIKDLEGESEALTKIREKINSVSPGEAHEMLIKVGQLVENMVQEWKKEYTEKVFKQLRELSIDARLNDVISPASGGILNASFLVDKTKEKEFDTLINELDSKYGNKINFKYVGPLPPYNFIKLELKLEN